jgi:hypothetical protein
MRRAVLIGSAVLAAVSLCQARDDARHWLYPGDSWRETIEQTDARLRGELEDAQAEYDAREAEWQPHHAESEALRAEMDALHASSSERMKTDPEAHVQDVRELAARLQAAMDAEKPFVEAKGRASTALHASRDDWQIWSSMPEDKKQFLKIQRDRCRRSEGFMSREEVVKEIENFVEMYPDSTKVPQALFDAACLYTAWAERGEIRVTREPDRAREYYSRIVERYPDLLTFFTVAARHELNSLYVQPDPRLAADLRSQGRVRQYRWLLGVTEEQRKASLAFLKRDWDERDRTDEYLLGQIEAVAKNDKEAVEANIIGDARDSSDPQGSLQLLCTEFPGTRVAELAAAAIVEFRNAPRPEPEMMPALPPIPSVPRTVALSSTQSPVVTPMAGVSVPGSDEDLSAEVPAVPCAGARDADLTGEQAPSPQQPSHATNVEARGGRAAREHRLLRLAAEVEEPQYEASESAVPGVRDDEAKMASASRASIDLYRPEKNASLWGDGMLLWGSLGLAAVVIVLALAWLVRRSGSPQ